MKTKILSATLAVLILLGVVSLAACSQPGEPGNETTASVDVSETTGAPETTSKYDVGDALGTLNYGGETISIVSRSNKWVADEIYVEDSDGGLIVSAVDRRNKVVEQRLGIKIENTKVDGDNYAVSDIIRNQAQTGHVYDLFANSVYSTIMYTTENCFADLKSIDTIDLSQPYWSQGFNDSASIGSNQYFVTGAIALSTYRFIFATFFNSNMFAEKADIPSLYETVRDHKWTVDYQMELCKQFWVDTDADQVTSQEDICGFITNSYISVDPYWSAFNLPILTKDSDNYLVYSVDVERTTTAVEKMNQLFWSTEGVYSFKHETSDAEQSKIAKKFSEGTAAMATLRLIEVEDEYLRNMTDKYGIIPLPMLNEEQDDYYSYAHDQMTAFGMANTVSEDRREMLGAVLEAMASESYRYITPAYYEVALKSKYVSDPESWTMLDLVTNNLYIDAGVLYTKSINSVHQMFRTIVGSNSGSAATKFTSIKKPTLSAVDKLNESLRDIVGQ